MKPLFICLLLCFFLKEAFGQVYGKIINKNGQPVVLANVLLLKDSDTIPVKTAFTNAEGIYRFGNVASGNYFLRVSYTGYAAWTSALFSITGEQPVKDFGTITLDENADVLKNVVVRSVKPLYQQRPEGTIVNVESSVMSKGSSALEVLERSPGVLLDYRNNSVSLNGKSGVVVMIDGKLLRMTMEQLVSLLGGMSADDISTIELLTTPPANYDAEGSAGIINIVLKKNRKQGTNGSASFTGGYGWGEKATAGINLSHNTKNINLYGSYTFSHDKTYSDLYITSTQVMNFLGGNVSVLFLDTTKMIHNNHDANIGMDIKLNAKTTIGGSITFNKSTGSSSTFNDAGYNILPDSLLQFTGVNKGTNKWNNLVNSAYFERTISEGEKLNFNIDYLYFNNSSPYEVQSSFINKHGQQAGEESHLFSPQQKGFANTVIKVGVVKTDYTKQLNKKTKLETGLKGSYTTSSSLSGLQSYINGAWMSSDETSNHIAMKEAIGAAYLSFNIQVNSSVNLVAGVRYEYSYTNMDDPKTGANIVNRKLGSLFPNVFFSKKLNDNAELQLSYTKRISRPSYNDLASYVGYSDPTAVYTGNPFLKPTITHNIKIGYTYKSYAVSLLFSKDNNAIVRYQLTESTAADILYISPHNLASQNNITLQANLPFKLNNWWTMNYSFAGGLRNYKADYTKHPFEKNYFGYSANFSQTFKLPENFTTELSGWYNSISYNGTSKVNGFGALNIGVKKELKNNKGTLSLSAADILRTERINVFYGAVTEEAFSIKSHVIVTTESAKFPIIKLTYTKSFGNNGIKRKTRQQDSSTDESERIRKN